MGRTSTTLVTTRPWLKGKLRESFMDLPKHTIIWVRRSNHIYAVGPTWWLMKGDKLYQVTETYAGTKLKNLLTFIVDEEPVSTAYDQELHNKLNSQARRLLP